MKIEGDKMYENVFKIVNSSTSTMITILVSSNTKIIGNF